MKLSVMHVTGDYRGDHETDVQIAIDVHQLETVGDLVRRTLQETRAKSGDHLQIRLVIPREGER